MVSDETKHGIPSCLFMPAEATTNSLISTTNNSYHKLIRKVKHSSSCLFGSCQLKLGCRSLRHNVVTGVSLSHFFRSSEFLTLKKNVTFVNAANTIIHIICKFRECSNCINGYQSGSRCNGSINTESILAITWS